MNKSKRHNILIVLMFVAATVLISLALPRQGRLTNYSNLSYEKGKPWLNPMLTAPFDIPIERTDEDKARITDSVKTHFVKICTIDQEVGNANVARLRKELNEVGGVSEAVKSHFVAAVIKAYDRGIVDSHTADSIDAGYFKQLRVKDERSVAHTVETDGMLSTRQVYASLDTVYSMGEMHLAEVANLNQYLAPNVIIDDDENNQLIQAELDKALMPVGLVQTGEAIIFTGNIVTDQKDKIITSLKQKLEEKSQESKLDKSTMEVGKVLLITIIMFMYCFFLIYMRYRVFSNMKSMVFLISFMTLFVMAVFLLITFKPNCLYMIPFAIVPVIIMTFFDSRISFFTHIVVILLCSLVATEQAQFIIMQFLAGCIAIPSMQELTRRSQLVSCAIFIFIAYSATYFAIYLSRGGSFSDIDTHYFLYFAINCSVLSFAYVAIFVVEKLFGFTSLVTLVELSDINTPLLRKLSESCPGTFQHVLQVANIAAEAAIKVGASQQLVRAGALYHDIGKCENPAFFTENQGGVNPHDSLEPEQSAQIVIRHVTDGLRMAEKARLPQVIRDLIVQHHGTSTARFFYIQACQANGGEPVDPAPYTYPGPKPQSKEAAILMMADACEAAARSLNDYSEKSISALVSKIVDGQIASGQLQDSPLSFKQVEIIKKVFVERLKIFHHRRISYPEDIKPAVKDGTGK